MENIFKTIREERADFLNNEIEVVPGYTFNQYNNIKKIHLYYNWQFEKGNYETVNWVTRKKVFHNINRWRCEVATKMIDLDVKDFMLVSNNPEQDFNVYLLEKELKLWLKKHDLGMKLNDIVERLPVYGSVVLEKVANGVEVVDLRYLYNDQTARSLKDARYINIRNFMTAGELRKMKGKWENIDEALEKFSGKLTEWYDSIGGQKSGEGSKLFFEGASTQIGKPTSSPYVEVWKRYGEVPKSFITGNDKDTEYVLALMIVAGIDVKSENDKWVILAEEGVVLYSEELKELPLSEVHYTKTDGRWLGIGVVEATFEPQRRVNEIKNQESKAMEISSLHLYQTRDNLVASNITTDLENGQILQVKSEITPISTENRDMRSFESAMASNETLADRLTFSYDTVRGEQAPASATLGSIQIQEQQATSAFDYKRENVGLFLSDYIRRIVLPGLEKELNGEHILRLCGSVDEIGKLRQNYAKNYAFNEFVNGILNEQVIDESQYEQFKQIALDKLKQDGDKLWVKIDRNFFKGLDFEVDIVITGENRNLFRQIQNSQALLQTIGADPTMLQDPVKRKLLFKLMGGMGMHTSELEEMEQAVQEQQAQPQMPWMQAKIPQLSTELAQANAQ